MKCTADLSIHYPNIIIAIKQELKNASNHDYSCPIAVLSLSNSNEYNLYITLNQQQISTVDLIIITYTIVYQMNITLNQQQISTVDVIIIKYTVHTVMICDYLVL